MQIRRNGRTEACQISQPSRWIYECKYDTIMDLLLSKHGLIFTEFDSIDRGGLSKYGLIFTEFDSIARGGAEVNTFKFSKYQTIFTE